MTEKKKRIWPRMLLAASLALNLLVVGVVAGGLLSRNHGPEGRAGTRDTGMFALIVMLPPEERAALRNDLEGRSGGVDGKKVPNMRHHSSIIAALRADPFEAESFRSILSERRKDRDVWAENAEIALTESVSGMTAAQRMEYAKRLDRWSRNRNRKDHGGREKR